MYSFKAIAAAAALVASSATYASSFLLVAPLASTSENLSLELIESTMPVAATNWAYYMDLRTLLKVDGEPWTPRVPISWRVIKGSLPPGLSLTSAGEIVGTTTTSGTYSISVQATAISHTTKQEYLIKSLDISVKVGQRLADAHVGDSYSKNIAEILQVEGESSIPASEVAWEFIGGELPEGLTFNAATGQVSGIPVAASSTSFTIKARYKGREGSGAINLITYQLVVGLASSTPPPAIVGVPYEGFNLMNLLSVSGQPDADALKDSVTWEIISGKLPDGLSMDAATGAISGTPTEVTSNPFTVKATVKSTTGQQSYQIHSTKIAIGFNTIASPTFIVNVAGSFANDPAVITGDPYMDRTKITYSITGLPEGLSMDSKGVIQGTSAYFGLFTPTLTAHYKGLSAQTAFNLPVGTYVSGSMSEDATLSLSAPAGTLFREIQFSSFGTVGGGYPAYSVGWCHTNPYSHVYNAFIGRASGAIWVSRGTFGDPCRNTRKVLAVTLVAY